MAVLTDYEQALLEHLQSHLTPERLERFKQVLGQRTRRMTVVLSDVHRAHNISAVLRSCDACGVQDVHVIESNNRFETNREISLGSDQWLTLHRYTGGNAAEKCLAELKSVGYRVVATDPHAESCPLDELPIDRPLALLFGGEKTGLSLDVIEQAELTTFLPMVGFVESFNISVAAALFVFNLANRIRRSSTDWKLSQSEWERLFYKWVRSSVPHLGPIERRFREEWEAAQSQVTNEGPN